MEITGQAISIGLTAIAFGGPIVFYAGRLKGRIDQLERQQIANSAQNEKEHSELKMSIKEIDSKSDGRITKGEERIGRIEVLIAEIAQNQKTTLASQKVLFEKLDGLILALASSRN